MHCCPDLFMYLMQSVSAGHGAPSETQATSRPPQSAASQVHVAHAITVHPCVCHRPMLGEALPASAGSPLQHVRTTPLQLAEFCQAGSRRGRSALMFSATEFDQAYHLWCVQRGESLISYSSVSCGPACCQHPRPSETLASRRWLASRPISPTHGAQAPLQILISCPAEGAWAEQCSQDPKSAALPRASSQVMTSCPPPRGVTYHCFATLADPLRKDAALLMALSIDCRLPAVPAC